MPGATPKEDVDDRPHHTCRRIRATPVTLTELRRRKGASPPLVWVTAYDQPTARLAQDAGVDTILVGDSIGTVVLGHPSTLPVTVDDMVRAAQAVSRGAGATLRVVDLPYLSYASADRALANAGRLLVEGGAHAVKLEGGAHVVPQVEALTRYGIPVVGHLGYTPQASPLLGRQVQGRGEAASARLREDAARLCDAGIVALVLEMVPSELCLELTARLPVPTIGIGAGAGADGQVLVLHDLVGLTQGHVPRFSKTYADVAGVIRGAIGAFAQDVREGRFPAPEHEFHDGREQPPPAGPPA